MLQISSINAVLMLWLVVTAISFAVMLTPNNQPRIEIKDAALDVLRILFVAAWIGALLVQVSILAKGPEGERTTATSDLDSGVLTISE